VSTQTGAPKGITPPSGGGRSGFLSDVIVELEFATRDTVEQAVRAARSPGTTVARVLVDTGAITEEQLARATAERYGIDYIDLAGFDVDPAAANLIKPTAARRYQAVPVAYLGSRLLVAMADPADALGVNDIAVMTKLEVRPAVAARPALEALLEALPLDELGWEVDGEPAPVSQEEQPEPEAPASSAVFWQDGGGDELPAAAAPPAPEAGDDSHLRAELEALKRQLAGAEAKLEGEPKPVDDGEVEELRAKLAEAEAELDEARVRVREAKEVGAELESLRGKLQAAEAGLDQASARVRDGDALAAEAEELRAQVTRLRHERDELRSELRRVGADADVRTSELESLRTKLTNAETELVRVRAEADARGSELEALRTRTESAEQEVEQALHRASESETELEAARRRAAEGEQRAEAAHRRAAELERDAADARRLTEELAAADARTEEARQAVAQLREESEREREQAAMTERGLREQLGEEERRRAELEGRLSEVEGAAFAAERSFEELRLAQRRMRGALRALADPDGPDAA
jgi:type II secretion system (T2SS) protein E